MEFVINEFLSLKMENDITTIYVAEKPFQQCKFLLLEIPVRDVTSLDEIKSIDEAAQELSRSLEPQDEFSRVAYLSKEFTRNFKRLLFLSLFEIYFELGKT